jgi:methylated-DNA-[protein]-cysteine S-methyltransferase
MAYLQGRLRSFDLPLAPAGTPFQRQVWEGMAKIPYGATQSYGELARKVKNPGATQAVGSACGANPIPLIIPCHRVLAAAGRLGGFGLGLDAKRWLLDLETYGRPPW